MNNKLCASLAVVVLLTLASKLPAAERVTTSITVKDMHCAGCVKKNAARLYAVRGVKEVCVDMKKKTLFVTPQANATLSPRALWEAVEKAGDQPVRLSGPSGTFTAKPRK